MSTNFLLLVVGIAIAAAQGSDDLEALRESARELNITISSSRTPYVKHGKDAQRLHWPFIVPIFQLVGGGIHHICGGSIVHPMFILTAAHCFRQQVRNAQGRVDVKIDDDKRGYRVHAGDYNIASIQDGAYVAAIDRIIVHDMYKGLINNDPYDIALIKLRQPLVYNNFVKQVPLAPANAIFDTGAFNCHAAGWGLTDTGRNRAKPNILQQLDAKVLHVQSCKNFWGKYITQNNMCLGNGMKATCRGDSGGPAVCPLNNAYVLAGIMSFGVDDCEEKPGVLLKIPPFIKWINTQVTKYANVRG